MPRISRSVATLRIIGDDLVPDEITGLLGVSPTKSHAKGDKIAGRKSVPERIACFGMWCLHAEDCEPEDLNGQIRFVIDQLTNDLSVWETIASRYEMDLFCGFFMKYINEEMEVSPESLMLLGSRGIALSVNVYYASDDEERVVCNSTDD